MSTKVALVRAQDVLAEHLQNPAFRAEWEQTAVARAVALAVVSYRAKHGLTQTQLAQRLAVRQQRVAQMELGERAPSVAMLQRLVQVLGLWFIIAATPAGATPSEIALPLPPDVTVLADVTANGSRVLIAAA